ncbi:MAG TPA: hypothetical protein VFY75_10445 [Solirubrobacterales bacterium]|nr:hypothetical protein [Solirubrobacterales bacterium]
MQGTKLVGALIVAVALLCAVPAIAAEATPESFKAAAEPICKTNREANEKVLDGARQNVQKGKLKKASRQLFSAAKALKRARAQLLALQKPAEDAARLTKWLKGIKTEVELLESTGRKLADGDKNGALKMIIRLKSNANRTNNLVLDYEFRYCHINPSEFL